MLGAIRINSVRHVLLKRNGYYLCQTNRHYSNKKKELCPPDAPIPNPSSGTRYTIGLLTLVAGGTIGFAKYDPDFRSFLTESVPFTDDVIKFVFQEEKTYFENMQDLFGSIALLFGNNGKMEKKAEIKEKPLHYKAPPTVITPLAKDEKIQEECYTEVRLETKDDESKQTNVEIVGEPKPSQESSHHATSLQKISDLEMRVNKHATLAVEAYNKAVYVVKNYNNDIQFIIESSVENLDSRTWDSVKKKNETKDDALIDAEKNATEALQEIDQLKHELGRVDNKISESVKEQAKRNLHKVQSDLATARKKLDLELKDLQITEKYWEKVDSARKHFAEELKSLFPKIDLESKKLNISEGDLDLFVLHAVSKVLFYQKELHRLETLGDTRLKGAVEAARRGGYDVLSHEQVCKELEKERITLQEEFDKKCLKLRCESEQEIRSRLKTQSAAFNDHLNDALRIKEEEMERQFSRNFDEKITEERCKFKMQVAAMVGRLRGMDEAYKAKLDADKISRQAQQLWSSCQALYKAVKAGCPGVPWKDQLRPLDPEIIAVTKAAADSDELVRVVIAGIPNEAKSRGVFPEDALRERFLKVERVARSLDLISEKGARLHMYFLSYLQSFFLLRAASPIPQSELNDDITDFSSLSTNEIIQRARYWLDRGDFAQTLRYMNLLQGGARAIALQWMDETRILLETQQAANTLMAHAAASGLVYL